MGHVKGDWISQAEGRLLQQRSGQGAWGYRAGGVPCVEPTVLAALGLLAGGESPSGGRLNAAQAAADWLVCVQAPDGSLGVSEDVPEASWGTPYGLLLWALLPGRREARQAAADFLFKLEGKTYPDNNGVFGHDPALVGWPWIPGTHSWLEPTAMALLALRREGCCEHPRYQEGMRVICNRAISSGGWNYGNRTVFGSILHPQIAPTGIALVAIAGEDRDPDMVRRACRYLSAALPRVRAPRSLAWGLLGLAAWGKRPQAADDWLCESFSNLSSEEATALDLGLLLLAHSQRSLDLLGCTR